MCQVGLLFFFLTLTLIILNFIVTSFDKLCILDEPRDEDIHEQTKENGNTLNWKINISKIFPTPSCGADLNVSRIKSSACINMYFVYEFYFK